MIELLLFEKKHVLPIYYKKFLIYLWIITYEFLFVGKFSISYIFYLQILFTKKLVGNYI